MNLEERQTLLPVRYTRIAIALHWVIALLMIVNVSLVWLVDAAPDSAVRAMIDTHKSIGITVLGLALLRILWRLTHQPPAFPASYAGWERFAAHAAHVLLYVLMIGLPLSGWLHDSAWKDADSHPMSLYYLVPWPRIGFIQSLDPGTKEMLHSLFGAVHTRLGYGLYALFALHVGGALKHQFFDREPELQRMLP